MSPSLHPREAHDAPLSDDGKTMEQEARDSATMLAWAVGVSGLVLAALVIWLGWRMW